MRKLWPALILALYACDDGGGTVVVDATVPACDDGMLNGDETDVDCGGGCGPCPAGQICNASSDCGELSCVGGVCAAAGRSGNW